MPMIGTIENFDVVLEQAGPDEVVSLNYDSSDLDDYASLTLDRQEWVLMFIYNSN